MEKAQCGSESYVVLYDRPPSELLCAAKVASLTKEELASTTTDDLVAKLRESQPLSQNNELAAWKLVENLASSQLAKYSTSEEVRVVGADFVKLVTEIELCFV